MFRSWPVFFTSNFHPQISQIRLGKFFLSHESISGAVRAADPPELAVWTREGILIISPPALFVSPEHSTTARTRYPEVPSNESDQLMGQAVYSHSSHSVFPQHRQTVGLFAVAPFLSASRISWWLIPSSLARLSQSFCAAGSRAATAR